MMKVSSNASLVGKDIYASLVRRRIKVSLGLLLVMAVALLIPQVVENPYYLALASETLIMIGLAVSWSIFSGLTGYISFGHALFFGLGAYTTGLSMEKWGISIEVALLCNVVLVGLVAFLMGLMTLRLKGHYFAIATLGVAEFARALVEWGSSFTHGVFGFPLPMDVVARSSHVKFYWIVIVTSASIAIGLKILWSAFGMRMVAIREDEIATESLGINPSHAKIISLVISGSLTSLLGGLFAWTQGFVTPEEVFASRWSLEPVLMSILGGLGTLIGPIFGAIIFFLLPQVMIENHFILEKRDELYLVLVGVVMVLIMLLAKNGIVGILQKRKFWPKGFRL
jgi:branched-chain amino acid transport system permease protein